MYTQMMEDVYNIPFSVVGQGAWNELANKLDPETSIIGNNWRILAEKLGFTTEHILVIISLQRGSSWSWSYGSFNLQLPVQTVWVRITLGRGVLVTTLCDKVCQWLAAGQCFSSGTPVSSTNKTDSHYITEILLKVACNNITLTRTLQSNIVYMQANPRG